MADALLNRRGGSGLEIKQTFEIAVNGTNMKYALPSAVIPENCIVTEVTGSTNTSFTLTSTELTTSGYGRFRITELVPGTFKSLQRGFGGRTINAVDLGKVLFIASVGVYARIWDETSRNPSFTHQGPYLKDSTTVVVDTSTNGATWAEAISRCTLWNVLELW